MRGEGAPTDKQTIWSEVARHGHALSDPFWLASCTPCTTLKSFAADDSRFNTFSLDNNQRRRIINAQKNQMQRSLTIVRLLNMTAGGILRWALCGVEWNGLPEGNGQCHWLPTKAPSHTKHNQAWRHISPIPNLVKYPTLAHLGILGSSAIVGNPLYGPGNA